MERLVIQNTEYSDIIEIRAHHLLCMQGFQGYGYSKEFELNLEKIINYLDSHPYCRLKIVIEADIICRKCPHLKDGRCIKSLTSISKMDVLVLKKLGLSEGTEDVARNLFFKVNNVLNPGDLQEICGDCSWKDKCTWYLSF